MGSQIQGGVRRYRDATGALGKPKRNTALFTAYNRHAVICQALKLNWLSARHVILPSRDAITLKRRPIEINAEQGVRNIVSAPPVVQTIPQETSCKSC